jgi:hypothetical protein
MSKFVSEFGRFWWAVFNNWAGYSTGGIIVATVAFWHILRDVPISRQLGLGLAVVFLCMAFFKAWRDEYLGRVVANQKLRATEPDFVLDLGQIVIKYDPARDFTALLIHMQILNRGADSVAVNWHARYKSASCEDEAEINIFAEESISLPFSSGEYQYIIKRDDLMPLKTIRPVTKGSIAAGLLFVLVSGNRFDEILSGAATITVSVDDYLGKCYQADYVSSGKSSVQGYYPGIGNIHN